MLTFYSRQNCRLCEEGMNMMRLVQQEVPFEFATVDIEQDEDLHERYMMMIPVLEKDGEMIQYGILDYETIIEAVTEQPDSSFEQAL
ncbi:glutaredoxin family protein [Kurthia sp. Dielmo]|uniref:glutaredoxin family protein n=1 Tax=Kurthia sp. Dielmo TaxID=1033738 RepID=UPI0011223C61|nr:glutaredoxin family protein [Kurthia sp. Dielmo]